MILCLRTDAAIAELTLWNDSVELEHYSWEAGRQLASQLLGEIEQLLRRNKATLGDISGIVVYLGPGSFTGLRIGVAVANALNDSLGNCRLVGVRGDDWRQLGLSRLARGEDDGIVGPYYGGEAAVTLPRK